MKKLNTFKTLLAIVAISFTIAGCSESLVGPDALRSPSFSELARIDSIDGLNTDSEWLKEDVN